MFSTHLRVATAHLWEKQFSAMNEKIRLGGGHFHSWPLTRMMRRVTTHEWQKSNKDTQKCNPRLGNFFFLILEPLLPHHGRSNCVLLLIMSTENAHLTSFLLLKSFYTCIWIIELYICTTERESSYLMNVDRHLGFTVRPRPSVRLSTRITRW